MARKTKDFSKLIRHKLAADPVLAAQIEEERFGMNVGAAIFDARVEAGITQAKLAKMIGSYQSVIARMEDADYEGHTLAMLKRIGDALGKQLHIEFRPRFVDTNADHGDSRKGKSAQRGGRRD